MNAVRDALLITRSAAAGPPPATTAGNAPAAAEPRFGAELAALRGLGRLPTERGASRGELGALQHLGRQQDERCAADVRQAAELLASQLFFQPILAEVRKAPFQSEIGSGGRGEEVFGERLDLLLADRMAAADQGVVAELERHLTPPATPLDLPDAAPGAAGPALPGPGLAQDLRDAAPTARRAAAADFALTSAHTDILA